MAPMMSSHHGGRCRLAPMMQLLGFNQVATGLVLAKGGLRHLAMLGPIGSTLSTITAGRATGRADGPTTGDQRIDLPNDLGSLAGLIATAANGSGCRGRISASVLPDESGPPFCAPVVG